MQSAPPSSSPVFEEQFGLCVRCVNAQRIVSLKGSTFILCLYAKNDSAFAKYPRLPVVTCAAYKENSH